MAETIAVDMDGRRRIRCEIVVDKKLAGEGVAHVPIALPEGGSQVTQVPFVVSTAEKAQFQGEINSKKPVEMNDNKRGIEFWINMDSETVETDGAWLHANCDYAATGLKKERRSDKTVALTHGSLPLAEVGQTAINAVKAAIA